MVDDGGHTPHDATVAQRQIAFRLTEVEGGIALRVHRRHVVTEKIGRIVSIALVKIVMKIHEGFQVAPTLHLLNNYGRHRPKNKVLIRCKSNEKQRDRKILPPLFRVLGNLHDCPKNQIAVSSTFFACFATAFHVVICYCRRIKPLSQTLGTKNTKKHCRSKMPIYLCNVRSQKRTP